MNGDKEYYWIDSFGGINGPEMPSRLQELYRQNIISDNTEVCIYGSNQWLPYKTISGAANSDPEHKQPFHHEIKETTAKPKVAAQPIPYPFPHRPPSQSRSQSPIIIITRKTLIVASATLGAVIVVVAIAAGVLLYKSRSSIEATNTQPIVQKAVQMQETQEFELRHLQEQEAKRTAAEAEAKQREEEISKRTVEAKQREEQRRMEQRQELQRLVQNAIQLHATRKDSKDTLLEPYLDMWNQNEFAKHKDLNTNPLVFRGTFFGMSKKRETGGAIDVIELSIQSSKYDFNTGNLKLVLIESARIWQINVPRSEQKRFNKVIKIDTFVKMSSDLAEECRNLFTNGRLGVDLVFSIRDYKKTEDQILYNRNETIDYTLYSVTPRVIWWSFVDTTSSRRIADSEKVVTGSGQTDK